MGTEIERKFLVRGDAWRDDAVGVHMRQGYLSTDPEKSVRVRKAGDRAYLTIKGMAAGMVRPEYEYEIPVDDAEELLDRMCERPLIEKTRFRLVHAGLRWVVDEFDGENAGLVLAEVELEDENQAVDLPEWVDEEVTDDARYLNVNLAQRPYSRW